jgi:hypothetical protein
VTVLATPTPYLRDGLRRLVAGLKRDAETAHLNLAEAQQDVAAARALLAEAEAQHQRAKDAADALAKEIAFFEEQAERTPPAYDPDAALAATGLMPRDIPANTRSTWPCPSCGGALAWVGEHYEELAHVATGLEECPVPDDDLTAPGVIDSRAQIAALTGGHPIVPPPAPHEPAGTDAGTLAALDAGHPLTTRTDHAPSPRGQHAAPPRTSRVTGALRKVGLIANDEQDGDADE